MRRGCPHKKQKGNISGLRNQKASAMNRVFHNAFFHHFLIFFSFCFSFCFSQKTIKKRPIMKPPWQLGLQNLAVLSFGGSAKYKIRYACTMYEIEITSWKFHPYCAAQRACKDSPQNMPASRCIHYAKRLLQLQPLHPLQPLICELAWYLVKVLCQNTSRCETLGGDRETRRWVMRKGDLSRNIIW